MSKGAWSLREPGTALAMPGEARMVVMTTDPLAQAEVDGMLGGRPGLRQLPITRADDAHLLLLLARRPGRSVTEALSVRSAQHLPVLAVLDEPGDASPSSAAELAGLGVVACLWRAEVDAQVLSDEIRSVAAQGRMLVPARRRIGQDMDRYRERFLHEAVGPARSRREADVIRLMMDGRSVREIARDLGCSERTVGHTLDAVVRRTGARNRIQALTLLWRGEAL
ncbi:LuxR C-terminal-related transcriptional regulator [Kineosporia rhizophila]|uniref:helix-turn-helix transcriptional regulator n=1 Tax=Kineosporia rhizophila TaxID=84633 RepID=UPI001E32CCA9|nr:LuxR C-terminal-related transcriptional regulator [Kineosporia rhizophila]MCE0537710.1 LuxR C-terminal-related transcriptional regulator [Kineosporia rhizophila]